ncbi:formyltetrahydrofolate deformylase 1, mitochondrial isoform X5 [Carya illinoinensis]|uniref:formyltetrahydrofolate deformylase 1, mitochondrial isoform X5 n=1 Tax=Carya illinoinensis TaxID=32201 RepID=UPI001C723C81|nr:formyltetrahydrofolate deformylase 1, mitochondrial isoform X5 [Carya illinoinensis]
MNLIRRVSATLPHPIGFAFRSFRFPGDSLVSSSSSTLTHGVHVFQCPDAVGIVAKLSDCIASRGGNILGADVFVPENKNVFYSRSFQDHCLVDLLHGWQDGRLPVDITCVISNHERGANTHVIRFLERHGIPYHHIHTTMQNKREGEILELVQNTQFLVLARYMQILSGDFLKSYGKDIINIHHGLLPSFKGGNPSKQAFDSGVKLIGATSHFVTEELDAGPIIEQMVERVSHRDNMQSFVQKSENLEKQCLAKAMKSYCELRVLPYEQNRTVVF